MKIIPVTCALIIHRGKVLAAQRSEAMDLPGKWEFPGGKVEAGEEPIACLIREIREELSIDVEIHAPLPPVDFQYPDKIIRLIPFLASWSRGEIRLLEHRQVVWLECESLFSVDWAAADIPVVQDLHENWVKLVTSINARENG